MFRKVLQVAGRAAQGRRLRDRGTSLVASAAAAAVTAPTTTAVTAAAATAAAFGLRPGLVHRQGAALDFGAVERSNGGLRLGVRAHLDEAEAFRATRVAVHDHLRRGDRPMRLEQTLQVT